MSTPTAAFARLLEVLDRMEIPYEVVGSLASSAHGLRRTTTAIDLVGDLRVEQMDEFASYLANEFYADAEVMQEALARGLSERHWSDIRGMFQAAGQPLDLAYLRKWAPELGVSDLLENLLAEFGM
ncbi:MAG TPA: hypothetical protein VML19_01560 [Verrucomicrobiae bacterium]|nr:hypothetical protein [Verrucomicrobiae bacterium]